MDNSSEEGGSTGGRRSLSASPKGAGGNAPYSPYAFGSPLTCSTRSILSPHRPASAASSTGAASNSTRSSVNSNHSTRLLNRFRGSELYGGPVMFGGERNRRGDRLMSSSPYASALRTKSNRRNTIPANHSVNVDQGAKNNPSSDGMSSTAKLILDTLDKMSTPLRDARKIPTASSSNNSRADKRRVIAEELDSSLNESIRAKRRRPNLGGAGGGILNGPPLRTFFSPVVNIKQRSSAASATTSPKTTNISNISPSKKLNSSLPPSHELNFGLDAYNRLNPSTPTATSSFNGVSSSIGGKIRAKVGEKGKLRAEKAMTTTTVQNDIPITTSNFSFLKSSSPVMSPVKPLTRNSSSASTVLINNDYIVDEQFAFSNPTPIELNNSSSSDDSDDSSSMSYTFSLPSSVPDVNLNHVKSPSLTNGHTHTSSVVINHKLPDLTNNKLKSSGSVLDILSGGNHHSKKMLPNITSSTGGLKQGSVLNALGGGWKRNIGGTQWN